MKQHFKQHQPSHAAHMNDQRAVDKHERRKLMDKWRSSIDCSLGMSAGLALIQTIIFFAMMITLFVICGKM